MYLSIMLSSIILFGSFPFISLSILLYTSLGASLAHTKSTWLNLGHGTLYMSTTLGNRRESFCTSLKKCFHELSCAISSPSRIYIQGLTYIKLALINPCYEILSEHAFFSTYRDINQPVVSTIEQCDRYRYIRQIVVRRFRRVVHQ